MPTDLFTIESKLRFFGYIYSEPYAEWNYPHLIGEGGVIPVSGLTDPFVFDLVKKFEEAHLEIYR